MWFSALEFSPTFGSWFQWLYGWLGDIYKTPLISPFNTQELSNNSNTLEKHSEKYQASQLSQKRELSKDITFCV
jgi:hypothetical protein